LGKEKAGINPMRGRLTADGLFDLKSSEEIGVYSKNALFPSITIL
jgi:hypothetical protein